MKIAILSRSPRALQHAPAARGVRAARAPGRGAEHAALQHAGRDGRARTCSIARRRLSRYDAVIPRIGASVTLLRHRGRPAVRADGRVHPQLVAGDHRVARQAALAAGAEPPPASASRRPPSCAIATACCPRSSSVGGAPVIIKLLEGTQGIGVILADNNKIAEAIIETLQSARQNVLIQKFVEESKGRDMRAFVVGDRVVAAMRRMATGEEFRSNVHRGGRAEPVELDPDYERTADPRRADHGASRRRRRHARGRGRPAGHGGQLLAGPRGHRDARQASTSPTRSSSTSRSRCCSPSWTCASG